MKPTRMYFISVGNATFQASDENFFQIRRRFSSGKGPLSTITETNVDFRSRFRSNSHMIRNSLRTSIYSVNYDIKYTLFLHRATGFVV